MPAEVRINTEGLGDGTYFLKVTAGERRLNSRLLILR
jgi:hypothetical protein